MMSAETWKEILPFVNSGGMIAVLVALIVYAQTRKGSRDTLTGSWLKIQEDKIAQHDQRIDKFEERVTRLAAERDRLIEDNARIRQEKHNQAAEYNARILHYELANQKMQDCVNHLMDLVYLVADRLAEQGTRIPEVEFEIARWKKDREKEH